MKRTAQQLRDDGAAAERTATVAYLKQRAGEVATAKGLNAAERSMLRRRLDNVTEEIAQGFHR